jgi:hypothetical protein
LLGVAPISSLALRGDGGTLRRRSALICALVALSFLALGSSAKAADLLPDLGMARLNGIRTEQTVDGRRLLRYTTVIVNVGRGPFELFGQRASTGATQMSAAQRIYNDAGGSRQVATAATMVFGGDGHDHWHVRDLETSVLTRLDNGVKVGTGAKHGFCFFDGKPYRLTLPGAPQSPVYNTGCGTSTSLTVTMGLSVGWGDVYAWSLPDQYVDITGLTSGQYRLATTADAPNWFVESNNSNNPTWVDLQLRGDGSIRVIRYGPAVDELSTPPPPPPPPPPSNAPPPPSNEFSFGEVKKNKRKGTAKLTVEVAKGPGELELAKTKKVKADDESAEDAGKEKLSIKPKGKAKKKLNRKGNAKVKAEVTFTPTGGTPNTKDKKIKLVKG